MKVQVLGCSGGIGGDSGRTTSLRVDGDILIDAGTGLSTLPLPELAAIDHVFLTHAHLDHIAILPLMIDAVADGRSKPVTVHAMAATIETIRRHIFNGVIWPDFSQIPVRNHPVMQFEPLSVGQTVRLGERAVTALPAEHTVPAVGYQLDSGRASLVFTGDTTANDPFWAVVNRIANLRYLLIETAFSDRDEARSRASKHLCPRSLAAGLCRLERPATVFITHLKSGQEDAIMGEIAASAGRPAGRLRDGHVFDF